MKVSIITVCLNSEKTIADTVKSIEEQTYDNIEHIVIDGGSTDGTMEILNNHSDSISKIISENDKGVYDAMNKGLDICTGDVVGFLNADDFYANNTIVSQIVDRLQANDLDAIYGDLVYVDRFDTSKIVRYWKPGNYKKNAFFDGWVMPHPTFFCRKNIYLKHGYYNDNFKIAADFELMLRFIEKHKIKIGYLPEIIVKMRTGGKANILSGIIRGNLEIIRSFRLNGLSFSPKLFLKKPITKILQLFKKPIRTI